MKIHLEITNLTKFAAVTAIAFILLGASACAETVYGFVTNIDSPTEFDVGSIHAVISKNAVCVLLSGRRIQSVCNTKTVSVFSNVRLVGKENNGIFVVDKFTVYDFALLAHQKNDGIILEENPILSKSTQGLNGNIWMDGYPITITPKTRIISDPEGTIFSFGYDLKYIGAKAQRPSKGLLQVTDASKLGENACVVFHAERTPDGRLIAKDIQFWSNWIDPKEKKYDKKFVMAVHLPDYIKGISGTIQYQGATPIVILPDKDIQDWVTNLGKTLIPAYQKNLLDSDATKITFQFYVVHTFPERFGKYFVETHSLMPNYQILYWDKLSRDLYNRPSIDNFVHTIVAAPDGTILIPDEILVELRDSAQLATLLSVAITSIIQRQEYHTWPYFFHYYSYLLAAMNGPWQTHQALRIGIRQMYLAGYDIREAPFAWAVAQGKPVNNPIINSKHPDQEIPWYAAYAFNYISQYYKDVDYSKLKKGEAEYQQFLDELRKADPEAFEKK